MPIAIPKSRPKITLEEAEKILNLYKDKLDRDKYAVIIIGIRAYYLNSIGKAESNDRNVYDDAYLVITRDKFATFNANADPTSYREGYGLAENTKGLASLVPGLYFMWKLDLHKGKYLALCQRLGPCTVMRDGNPPYLQPNAWIGLNCHKGGVNSTTSLACQTIYPDQYDEFIQLIKTAIEAEHGPITEQSVKDGKTITRYRDLVIPNILIEEIERRKL